MAGVAGKSGRKSNVEEEFRFKTVSKAWKLIDQHLENPALDLKFRLELAAKLCVKSIPQEINGDLRHQVTEMPAIQKEYPGEAMNAPVNRIAEYIIGSPHSPQDT